MVGEGIYTGWYISHTIRVVYTGISYHTRVVYTGISYHTHRCTIGGYLSYPRVYHGRIPLLPTGVYIRHTSHTSGCTSPVPFIPQGVHLPSRSYLRVCPTVLHLGGVSTVLHLGVFSRPFIPRVFSRPFIPRGVLPAVCAPRGDIAGYVPPVSLLG